MIVELAMVAMCRLLRLGKVCSDAAAPRLLTLPKEVDGPTPYIAKFAAGTVFRETPGYCRFARFSGRRWPLLGWSTSLPWAIADNTASR